MPIPHSLYYTFPDHIAIPDFQAGAMENWGLITYLMRALLVDQKTASPADLQWAAVVISHELAHQVCGTVIPVLQDLETTGMRDHLS